MFFHREPRLILIGIRGLFQLWIWRYERLFPIHVRFDDIRERGDHPFDYDFDDLEV